MTLPLAHIGHWLWIFYLLPVLIVVVGVIRSSWVERRKGRRLDDSEPTVAKSRKARMPGRGAKGAS